MGNCCTSQSPQLSDDIEYSEQVTIRVKEKDQNNKTIRLDTVVFHVTSPISQISKNLAFAGLSFALSACVLPGLDPRMLVNKDCQDGIICVEHADTILLGLFDGHGKDGLKVAHFCCSFMKEFFVAHHSTFLESPKTAIEEIIEACDKKLRSNPNEFDAMLSGTTAVVLFITGEGIHIGSVGDSRAILATIPNSNTPMVPPPASSNPYIRKIEPSRQLKPVALTIDQKPNHDVELARIEKSGGKVQQLTDDYGHKVGPFRVWQKNGILPGLAMSRSIGDGVAKEIGVIATPIYHFFQHIMFRDQFIVMASDGVWDVMENIEVVNFVERFRKKCIKKNGPKAYPHRVNFI